MKYVSLILEGISQTCFNCTVLYCFISRFSFDTPSKMSADAYHLNDATVVDGRSLQGNYHNVFCNGKFMFSVKKNKFYADGNKLSLWLPTYFNPAEEATPWSDMRVLAFLGSAMYHSDLRRIVKFERKPEDVFIEGQTFFRSGAFKYSILIRLRQNKSKLTDVQLDSVQLAIGHSGTDQLWVLNDVYPVTPGNVFAVTYTPDNQQQPHVVGYFKHEDATRWYWCEQAVFKFGDNQSQRK